MKEVIAVVKAKLGGGKFDVDDFVDITKLLGPFQMDIFLDGNKLKSVTEINTNNGSIDRIVLDENDNPTISKSGDSVETITEHGDISVFVGEEKVYP